MVYIAEAHALDGFSPNTRKGSPIVEEPETMEERLAVAGKCVVSLSIAAIPAVVDRMDNAALNTWAAWPDRLFLIGKDGRVAYSGAKGPRGFDPSALEVAIRKELENNAGTTQKSQ